MPRFAPVVRAHRSACFHEVTTGVSADLRGLASELRLPDVDLRRHHGEGRERIPLDSSSVYLGGHARGHETDIGLTWDRRHDAQGRPTFNDRAEGADGGDPGRRFVEVGGRFLSAEQPPREATPAQVAAMVPSHAFRVFVRTPNSDPPGVDGFGQPTRDPGSRDPWINPDKRDQRQCLYPGERVRMALETSAEKRDTLRLSLAGEGHAREREVHQQGFGPGVPASFKRVNPIDQFTTVDGRRRGLENLGGGVVDDEGVAGRQVRPTRARVTGAGWSRVEVLRASGGPAPLDGRRGRIVRPRRPS